MLQLFPKVVDNSLHVAKMFIGGIWQRADGGKQIAQSLCFFMKGKLLVGPEVQYFLLFVMEGFVGVRSVMDGIVSEVVTNFFAGLQFELLSMLRLGRIPILVKLFGLGC